MSAPRQRLLGMELYADRPGDSAAFYAWLLGPGSGHEPQDWNPVSLLFSHGVCGVRRTENGGPSGWVPVLKLDDGEASQQRMEAAGGRAVTLENRAYLVDPHGIWTRIVQRGKVPPDIDPEAVGETNADYYAADAGAAADWWADVLGMERIQILGDVDQLNFVVGERRPAFGTVTFVDEPLVPLAQPSWVVYFAVPDIPLSMQRAAGVGTGVAIPPSHEEYNDWCVLVDPFGVPFGLSLYYHWSLEGLRVMTPRGEEAFADAVDLPQEE
jgi:predicted enzyme related to lactoylglutathione lyase